MLNVIYTAHGWPYNEERFFLVKAAFWFLMWLAALLSDKVIAVSQGTLRSAPKLWVRYKFTLIHNGIGEETPMARGKTRNFFSEKCGLAQNAGKTFWIGTLSELTPNKGLRYAIEALAGLKSFPLFFIILGEGELRRPLEKVARDLGVEDRVCFFGHLDEAAKYLPAFDIFLLTSVTEAFSYALLEAGRAGLPVIATKIGGTPEIVEDGKTGLLVEPKNPEKIRGAIKKLLEDEKLRTELGSNLQKKVAEKFMLEEMLKRTTSIYETETRSL